jgi:type II secretory pathway pseudopilin PulG
MTRGERGYAMAALLVGLSVMAIVLSVALPIWQTAARREREAELIFRGEQYAHAIELYSRRNGGYPPSLDVLEKGRFIRKLYKDPVSGGADFQPVFFGQVIAGQPVAPRQPGTAASAGGPGGRTGQPTTPGQARGARAGQPAAQPPGLGQASGQRGTVGGGPVIGVVSRSTAESLRLYNGRGRYNEWAFVATAMSQQAGAPNGAQQPTTPGPAGRRGGQSGPQRGAIPAPGGRAPQPRP